jgi:hypothetical protein
MILGQQGDDFEIGCLSLDRCDLAKLYFETGTFSHGGHFPLT